MSHPVAVKARFLRLLSALSCLTLLSMLGAIPAHAGSPTPLLAPVLEAAKNLKLADEHLAVTAIPLNGPGDARFLNADTPFNPGSIMKVVTTYAALELLGPTYQWHTRLYTDGKISGNSLQGNLYFAGSGDPKLTEERLWLLMRELRAMGLKWGKLTQRQEARLQARGFRVWALGLSVKRPGCRQEMCFQPIWQRHQLDPKP